MPPLSASLVLPDFPMGVGNRMMSILDHKGPASYSQLAIGTPPTGGDVLTAAECGLKFITAISAQIDSTGTWAVDTSMTIGGAADGVTQVRLAWIVLSTGLQAAGAANLSTGTVRLVVWGR